jgi:hypothetical protein
MLSCRYSQPRICRLRSPYIRLRVMSQNIARHRGCAVCPLATANVPRWMRPSAGQPSCGKEKRRRSGRPEVSESFQCELADSQLQTAHLCQGRIRLTRLVRAQAVASPATQRCHGITFPPGRQSDKIEPPRKTRPMRTPHDVLFVKIHRADRPAEQYPARAIHPRRCRPVGKNSGGTETAINAYFRRVRVL